ncbi:hypothetical protein C8R43DRAFT_1230265 [Mycena crocata]|nr:hypothetical protein C8R43DRAFT_1230265 [Mycena crocata]
MTAFRAEIYGNLEASFTISTETHPDDPYECVTAVTASAPRAMVYHESSRLRGSRSAAYEPGLTVAEARRRMPPPTPGCSVTYALQPCCIKRGTIDSRIFSLVQFQAKQAHLILAPILELVNPSHAEPITLRRSISPASARHVHSSSIFSRIAHLIYIHINEWVCGILTHASFIMRMTALRLLFHGRSLSPYHGIRAGSISGLSMTPTFTLAPQD